MAVAALVVAIVAVVAAVFAAVYARAQAIAAKGSLAIEQERHKAEQTPRFDAQITSGNAPGAAVAAAAGSAADDGCGGEDCEGLRGEFRSARAARPASGA
jgi:hypothetical protein